MPTLKGSDVTIEHLNALTYNHVGHLDRTLRNAIKTDNYTGVIRQLDLGRYRFLADPRLRRALQIERQALQHPDIPADMQNTLLDHLDSTLSLYEP